MTKAIISKTAVAIACRITSKIDASSSHAIITMKITSPLGIWAECQSASSSPSPSTERGIKGGEVKRVNIFILHGAPGQGGMEDYHENKRHAELVEALARGHSPFDWLRVAVVS